MEKMAGVYLQNPSLGDPASMEEELKGNAKELDKYSQELFKYQSYLAIIDKTPAPPPPPCYSKPSSNVQPPPAPSENAPPPAPSILVPPVEEPEEDGEFDDEERCRVLYDFEGRKIRHIRVVLLLTLLVSRHSLRVLYPLPRCPRVL